MSAATGSRRRRTRRTLIAATLAALASPSGRDALAQGTSAAPPAPPTGSSPASDPSPSSPSPSPSSEEKASSTEPAATDGAPKPSAPAGSTNTIAVTGLPNEPMLRYANTWDVNLEGGGGYVLNPLGKWGGLARARAGVLIIRNDAFYQFGATAEYMTQLERPAFGLQGEFLHLQLGTWIQAGAAMDTKGRLGGMLSVGLSIIGVEAQIRRFDGDDDPNLALFAKVRIPLGIIVYAIQTKK